MRALATFATFAALVVVASATTGAGPPAWASSEQASAASGPSAASSPASFTCVTSASGSRGSCFVATCQQLAGAVRSGASHVTLYRNLTGCDFPVVVRGPLTLRGACGHRAPGADASDAPCVIDAAARLRRQPLDACRQHCTSCDDPSSSGPIFDVRAGGRLTLINLELRRACNALDGAGGAVVVRARRPSPRDECHPTVHHHPDERERAWADQDIPEEDTRDDSYPHSDDSYSATLHARGVVFRDAVALGSSAGAGAGAGAGSAANGRGGAVALLGDGARGFFDGCRFVGNEAWGGAPSSTYTYDANVGEGGAAHVRGGWASFRGCEFVGNVAEKEGGAVYLDDGATATFEACTFARNRVHDDYWDGGAGVFLASPNTAARFDVVRFEENVVAVYPDARRRAMTCGGGAVSVVRGASASFAFALFEKNTAPRGGAVCVHDAVATYADAVFRSNRAAHPWFEHPPGNDVECVQCFEWDPTANADADAEEGSKPESNNRRGVPIATLDRCAYRRDEEARETFEGTDGAEPACAPPPGAFAAPDDDDDDETFSVVDAAALEAAVEDMGVDFAAAFAEGGVRSMGEEAANPNADRDDRGGSF